jgi:hypothetical protein
MMQPKEGPAEYPSIAVGERLRETLADLNGGTSRAVRDAESEHAEAIHITTVAHAESDEASETAKQLIAVLWPQSGGAPTPTPCIELGEGTSRTDTTSARSALLGLAGEEAGGAVLAVGHQPQLSWIADDLLNLGHRRPRRPPTPIDRAGLVCLQVPKGRRARLLWVISYNDEAAAAAVRDKIQRKMDTAKLLSGAVAFGLTATFGLLLDGSKLRDLGSRAWAVQTSGAVLLLAAILYFATMYAYDTLLMPERFWGERQTPTGKLRRRRGSWLVARPPSSAAWILYQNMMRIWRNLFTLASGFVGVGLGLLGYAALRLGPWSSAAVGFGILLVAALATWWSRPVLGSED